MARRNLIVTMAIGAKYLRLWKRYCEPQWRQYAARHKYEVLCIDKPLDTSARAAARSPAWQKCLVLSQGFSQQYEQVTWVDCDVLINGATAPAITNGVPIDKVAAASAYTTPTRRLHRIASDRNTTYWRARGAHVDDEATPAAYYANHELPHARHDEVVQSGVLVLSPEHHRALLEKVYYEYEARASWDWQHEMPPLSHELLAANCVHWLDHRFNQVWLLYALLHYPFLYPPQSPSPRLSLPVRGKRWMLRRLGSDARSIAQRACATTAFVNSYFLHFAASFEAVRWVNVQASSWPDCRLPDD